MNNTELPWKPLPALISDTFGTYFYGFHCTSKLRLFLTQFKCKCKHKSPAICHIDVLLMYERCLPNMYPVLNTVA